MSSGQPSDTEAPEEPRAAENKDDSDEDEGSTRPSSPRAGRQRNVTGTQGSARLESAADGGTGAGCRVSTACDSLFSWICRRTVGRGPFVDPARDHFRTMTRLYSSMSPAADSVNLSTQTHGAVFNLEYSPDGSVLTVACEQTEVLLFDPISSRHIKTLVEAHEDCVNNIRYTCTQYMID